MEMKIVKPIKLNEFEAFSLSLSFVISFEKYLYGWIENAVMMIKAN